MTSDSEIIAEVRNGRIRQFDHLFNRYSRLCLYYFHRSWHFKPETAQDLTQEVFLKAFRSLHQFQPGSSFKAWLLTISRTIATDHYHRVVRETKAGAGPVDIMPSTGSQEDQFIKRTLVQKALLALPERQREIIELRYFWELDSSEIGGLMGIPDGTVRSDLHHARHRLMEVLGEKECV